MLFTEKGLLIYGRVHNLVVNHQIQCSGEQFVSQFRRGSLHQIHMDHGITLCKPGQQGRQHIGGKQICPTNGDASALQLLHILHIILKPLLRLPDMLHAADVFPPQFRQLNGVGASVEYRKTDLIFPLFHCRA